MFFFLGFLLSLGHVSFGTFLISVFSLNFSSTNNILDYFESDKIQITSLIVSDYSEEYSHWNAIKSLGDWLKENKIPAISGIDTRMLTKHIREHGTMLGKIVFQEDVYFVDPDKQNLTNMVSIKEKTIYGDGSRRILLVDCGVKNNIIRNFLKRDTTVIRVPFDYDFTSDNSVFSALKLYFATCSLELTTEQMAIVAATLANGGVCPPTQDRVLEHDC